MAKKLNRRQRIKLRIRKKIRGTAVRPRMSIFRSNKEIYCQVIDDRTGHTLAATDTRTIASGTNIEKAGQAGKVIGDKVLALGIKAVVFDRGGYLYHGRVKALADGARSTGLAL